MNTIQSNGMHTNPVAKLSKSVDVSQGSPLQNIADPRFHSIMIRTMKRCRVAPEIPRQGTRSERSSWSSASIVSSTDFRSSEADLQNEFKQKLPSTNRKRFIGLAIAAVVLLLILVILSIVLPLKLIKNSSANSTSAASTATNSSAF